MKGQAASILMSGQGKASNLRIFLGRGVFKDTRNSDQLIKTSLQWRPQ